MNKKAIKISRQLSNCLKMPNERIFLVGNEISGFTGVIVFLMADDVYKNLDELKSKIDKCLGDINYTIIEVGNGSAVMIEPN